jgi:hypothetical protein
MAVQPSGDMSAQHRYDVSYDRQSIGTSPGDGWLAFSIVLLGIVGVLNTIGGIAAIGDSKFYVHDTKYVLGSLHTWGWVVLLIGVIQLLVAYGIYARNQAARWIGVLSLALNSIAQLLMIPAYPFWSLSIFALDIIAIYGLIVYGQKEAAV